MTDYKKMNSELEALTDGVPHRVANLANASALLYNTLDRINWAGFYLLEDGRLVLSAFQGKPACIEIAIGRGVCGAAVAQKQTLVVPDVHKFEGHIACDGASRSEIVVPLICDGEVVGVLDIDSPEYDRFSNEDRQGLELFAKIICNATFGNNA